MERGDGAVWVRPVAPGSVGLRPGDRLLGVNGEPVRLAVQVIRRVAEQPMGVPLRLTIERQGRQWQLEMRLPFPAAVGSPRRMTSTHR